MTLQIQPKSLAFHFSTLPDPRREHLREHSLIDILLISVCAMLCGAEGFVDFEQFGHARLEFLRGFLALPNGIPSHDTFARVFAMLDPERFAECFQRWTEGLRRAVGAEVVAIDGKSLRRSVDRGAGKSPIHMVSAWAQQNRLVLGQLKVDEKSNEVTAIPELLRALELTGCIVTIDAMGTQTKIATEIIEAKADYVLALKGNQSTLHEEVKTFLEDAKAEGFPDIAHGFLKTEESAHGREETRCYWVCGEVEWLTHHGKWAGLRTIGMVESTRTVSGKVSVERRFYITSLEPDVANFARAVRGHWAIENTLHWSLDVSLNEDQSRVRTGHAAQNLARLRHITLNLLQRETKLKRGIKGKQRNAAWDLSYLLALING
jgi:predicted transposase YbfD/YdcC